VDSTPERAGADELAAEPARRFDSPWSGSDYVSPSLDDGPADADPAPAWPAAPRNPALWSAGVAAAPAPVGPRPPVSPAIVRPPAAPVHTPSLRDARPHASPLPAADPVVPAPILPIPDPTPGAEPAEAVDPIPAPAPQPATAAVFAPATPPPGPAAALAPAAPTLTSTPTAVPVLPIAPAPVPPDLSLFAPPRGATPASAPAAPAPPVPEVPVRLPASDAMPAAEPEDSDPPSAPSIEAEAASFDDETMPRTAVLPAQQPDPLRQVVLEGNPMPDSPVLADPPRDEPEAKAPRRPTRSETSAPRPDDPLAGLLTPTVVDDDQLTVDAVKFGASAPQTDFSSLDRSTVLEKIALVLAVIAPPLGLLGGIIGMIVSARRRGWVIGLTKVTTAVGAVLTVALGIGAVVAGGVLADQAKFDGIVAESAAWCTLLDENPDLVSGPRLGWPAPADTINDTIEAGNVYVARWDPLIEAAPDAMLEETQLPQTRAKELVGAIEASRRIDDAGNVAVMESVAAASKIPAYRAQYCVSAP
jgi:hypothetical protein